MDDDQQFCLRWNNHQSTLVSVFDTLLEKGMHVDCTLAAEGQTLKAHKVVLSACSPYFESVLSQQYDKHPIIILKDVKYAELRAMMDYMYRGEVNISQDQLAALLKAAESLQIKGLSDNKPSRPPSRPAQAAAAHPPRLPSPPPQVRDGSIDSREGSASPTRRRKKARRMSAEGVAAAGAVGAAVLPVLPALPAPPAAAPPEPALAPPAAGDAPTCKLEEAAPRDGVEDLTLDEDADEQPAIGHNDVVRNFQWHMERSQDEIMNSSDSVRDSQGGTATMKPKPVSLNKLDAHLEPEPEGATTFAVLKTMRTRNSAPEDAKENKKQPPNAVGAGAGGGCGGGGASPPGKGAVEGGCAARERPRSAFNLFPRERVSDLPCAQYRTDKGYKCPNCQRCYNARKNLVRHVTLECGREPQFKCPYCAFSKHRRNELKKHLEKKHPEHKRDADK